MALLNFRKTFRRAARFIAEQEKILLAILAVIIVISGGFWYHQFASQHSDAPTIGGTYVEGVVSDKKEMGQISTRLTKASLLTFAGSNTLQGQLVESWTASADQSEFRFTLKDGVDRNEIMSVLESRTDIVGNVDVQTGQDKEIVIKLPEANPSFPLLMARPLFDYGPYKLGQANDQTTVFTRNTRAQAVPSYLNKIVIHSYATDADLEKALAKKKIDGAVSLTDPALKNWQHFPVSLNRYYAVIFNTNKAPFRDDGLRKQLTAGQTAGATPFTLTAADQEPYKSQAEALVTKWQALGAAVTLSLKPLAEVTGTVGPARNFQALLIGIDYGLELDPYYIWHSSQVRATGNNIAGVNNATIDDMVGKVRAALDPGARLQLLNDLHQTLTAQGVMMVVKQESFDYYLSDKIDFTAPNLPSSTADRFMAVATWSLK